MPSTNKAINSTMLLEGLIRLTLADEIHWKKIIAHKQIERYSTTRNELTVSVSDIPLDGVRQPYPVYIGSDVEKNPQNSIAVPLDLHKALIDAIKAYPDRKKISDTNAMIFQFLADESDLDH